MCLPISGSKYAVFKNNFNETFTNPGHRHTQVYTQHPKVTWDTQIHNLYFKAYKIYSVDESTENLGFLMSKERERMENQFTSYKYQFPVLPYDKC